MKNLMTTQKFVFGLLAAFVLAFGVQGVADAALTISSTADNTVGTDDIPIVYSADGTEDRSFTISVSGAEDGDTITITATTLSGLATTNPITIAANALGEEGGVSGGVITFDAPNSDDNNDDTIDPGEGESETWTWNSSITVRFSTVGYGLHTVTVSGVDQDDDNPADLTVNGYVMLITSSATVQNFEITDITDTPVLTNRVDSSIAVTVGLNNWTKVDLSVSGGKLYPTGAYLKGSRLSPASTVSTSGLTSVSVFTNQGGTTGAIESVTVRPNVGSTAKVTARIPGSRNSAATHIVTYFYNNPAVEKVSGDNQFGPINQGVTYATWRPLRQPLVIRVVDGAGSNKGVSEQWVQFSTGTVSPPDASSARFRGARGSVWAGADGILAATENNIAPLIVKTDSSGRARVEVLPGTAAASYDINYELFEQTAPGTPPSQRGGNVLPASSNSPGQPDDDFMATAIQSSTDASTAVIDKPASTQTPQTRITYNDSMMTVNVDTSSTNTTDLGNVLVNFTVTGGQITLTPGSNYRTSLSTVTSPATGTDEEGGNATVYVKLSGSSAAIVTAQIDGNHEDNGRHKVTYFYNYPYVDYVSGDNQFGAIGGRLEDPLVVRVLDGPSGRPVPEQVVKFTVAAPSNTSPSTTTVAGADDATTLRTFIPVPGTTVFVTTAGGNILHTTDVDTDSRPDGSSFEKVATSLVPDPDAPIFVQTDSSGEARVHLRLGNGDNPGTTLATNPATVGADGTITYNHIELTTLEHTVTATTPIGTPGVGVTFNAKALDDARTALLEIVSGDGQEAGSNRPLPEPLVVRTRTVRGFLIAGTRLEFRTVDGTLKQDEVHGTPLISTRGGGNRIVVETRADGEASVIYNVGGLQAARTIDVRVVSTVTSEEYDFEINQVQFGVNGGTGSGTPGSGTPGTGTPRTFTPSLSISISPPSGATGETGTLTVTARDETNQPVSTSVTLSASGVTLPPTVTSGQATPFTFPSATTTVTAGATNYTSATNQIVVTQATPGTGPGTTPTTQIASTLAIVSGNSQVVKTNQALAPFVVEVKDQSGEAMSGVEVLFQAVGGGTLSSPTVTTGTDGQASTTLTLPTTQRDFATYTVYATVIGVEGLRQQFTLIARKPVLSRLVAREGNPQTAYVGERLADPLEVQVLDTDGDPVAGVQVTFTVLSEESTGTATPLTQSDESDTSGYAGAQITPTGAGVIQIQASVIDLPTVQLSLTASLPPSQLVKVSGDDQNSGPGKALTDPLVVEVQDTNGNPVAGISVSFSVTSGGGRISARSAVTDTSGRAQTTLTLGDGRGENTVEANAAGISTSVTFAAISGAQVRVGAAQRPPLYWIDTEAGTLQRLVDARVESIARSIKNATHLVVDDTGGKIYWTAQPQKNAGRIWRANLDGTNPEKIRDITSTLMGLALDASGGTLYWTNSRGRIQSMSTSGGKITNVRQNLPKPTVIAFASGVLYWGEAGGKVRRMSLTGNQQVSNIATNAGEPIGITTGKGKVYWTEKTSQKAGRIRRANLNGSKVQNVKSLSSIPMGIAVDADNNKIYWTNSRGRIQRSNLVGGKIQNVVTDLVSPGILAIGTAQITDAETLVRQPTQETQQTTYSKYDINRDGAVNNADSRIVGNALGQSGNSIKNARTDVNKDGTVDVVDLMLVVENADDAAAAPAIDIDVKALDIDFDRVQEQIEMLLASGDISVEGQRVLMFLQHLLANARPSETVLLANYPNPFNPETWIPYHLAHSTDVKVRIYDAQGTLVRELTLGHQSAGYYTSRSRAAYWDGRNAFGERVASGIYFYQLQTDEMSPLRKMVILK